jgi:hypothetical protein
MSTDKEWAHVDNPVASDVEDPVAGEEAGGQSSRDHEIELDDGRDIASVSVASVVAHLGAAPTNWHQATVYFLTSKAEDDASMRKKAPLMFAWGVCLVAVQVASMAGMLGAMLHPACTSNAHCDGRRGFYCYTPPGREQGNCQMCGEAAPLPYYLSTIPVDSKYKTRASFKEYNIVWDQHYPAGASNKRSRTPDLFAGWNFTMVKQTCTPPVQGFRWEFEESDDDQGDDVVTITDRGDLPTWIPDADIHPVSGQSITKYTAASVARWCVACVQPRGIDEEDGFALTDDEHEIAVSIMNKRLLAMSNMDSMALLDWTALVLCSYVVGLNVAGEIKDISLCEMSATARAMELSLPWQVALATLGRIRSQFFLAAVMGAVPGVVLTQGGSAMDVAFNSIAILFIMDVDNLSYQFLLGERAKERVDAMGHVNLNRDQARALSLTKVLCSVVAIVGTLYMVTNGASVGAMLAGGVMAFFFKLSELTTKYKTMSPHQMVSFVVVTIVVQFMFQTVFLAIVISWYDDHA